MLQPGDRIRWETVGEAGLPLIHYGFVRGTNGDESRVAVMLDGDLKGDTIVNRDELAPVTITNIELRLRGTDLLADPSLRQGLVSLWTAEADQAGLEVRLLDYVGTEGFGTSPDACALAELRSGGQHYILRALTPSDGTVCVKADLPHPGET